MVQNDPLLPLFDRDVTHLPARIMSLAPNIKVSCPSLKSTLGLSKQCMSGRVLRKLDVTDKRNIMFKLCMLVEILSYVHYSLAVLREASNSESSPATYIQNA
jgi:hypothetical protein